VSGCGSVSSRKLPTATHYVGTNSFFSSYSPPASVRTGANRAGGTTGGPPAPLLSSRTVPLSTPLKSTTQRPRSSPPGGSIQRRREWWALGLHRRRCRSPGRPPRERGGAEGGDVGVLPPSLPRDTLEVVRCRWGVIEIWNSKVQGT
jgi:hypothetical protein